MRRTVAVTMTYMPMTVAADARAEMIATADAATASVMTASVMTVSVMMAALL